MVAVGVSVAVAVQAGVEVAVAEGFAVWVDKGTAVFVGGSVRAGTAVSCTNGTGSAVTALPKLFVVVSLLLMAMVGTSVGGTFFIIRQALVKIVTAARNARRFFIT
jgi:hypothetical protein